MTNSRQLSRLEIRINQIQKRINQIEFITAQPDANPTQEIMREYDKLYNTLRTLQDQLELEEMSQDAA